ncbi:MAG: nucleoside-diphosphate sugar epimerase/dehydratase, partial [Bacteroidota bacterium]
LLPAVCGVQIATFSVAGLYRGTLRYLGIGDLLKILKTTVFSVMLTGGVLMILPDSSHYFNLNVLIIDFYLLLTLVAGTRTSFHILNYFFRRGPRSGKQLLIYGANTQGILASHRIVNDDSLGLTVLGFLDDKPEMEGKRVNGYPVFGGHWKIPQIMKKYRVDQILVSCDTLPNEVLNRLQDYAGKYGILLRRSTLLLEEMPRRAITSRNVVAPRLSHAHRENKVVSVYNV